jgi:hypothetical protein
MENVDVKNHPNKLVQGGKSEREVQGELEAETQKWVDRSFNFIKMEVVEGFCEHTNRSIHEHIVNPSPADVLLDWLDEKDECELITEFFVENLSEEEFDIKPYMDANETVKGSFIQAYGEENWVEFQEWVLEQHENDISDYIYEQENYPMWNTLFEFRDSYNNSDEMTKKCIDLGLGIIEGLEPFNNMIFMTSCGHSFYGSYWIPLFLNTHEWAREKYVGISYDNL